MTCGKTAELWIESALEQREREQAAFHDRTIAAVRGIGRIPVLPIHAQQHDRFQQIIVVDEPPLARFVAGIECPVPERAEQQRLRMEHRDRWCWHPCQLRHNYATMIRKRFGIEEASNMLDHSSVKMTEV